MAYRPLAPASENVQFIIDSDDDNDNDNEDGVVNMDSNDANDEDGPAERPYTPISKEDHMKFWGLVRAPPPSWSAWVEERLSRREIWTSFCETIRASNKLKAEYTLEYTALRAFTKRLVDDPLATHVEAAMRSVYKNSRAKLEGILESLITVWCKRYNNLWLRIHAKFVFDPKFENKLMGHCSKQLVLLADWAIRADALTSLPGKAQDTYRNLFVSMCCLHVNEFPGGGKECARHLVALAVGVFLEGVEELKTKTEPSAESASAQFSGHPASTVHDASQLLGTLQTSSQLLETLQTCFSENVTTLAGGPVSLQTEASSQASHLTLGDSAVPRISAEEEFIRDSAYRQLARGHLLWQQDQDRLTVALLKPEVNENAQCTILYTNPRGREPDHTLYLMRTTLLKCLFSFLSIRVER